MQLGLWLWLAGCSVRHIPRVEPVAFPIEPVAVDDAAFLADALVAAVQAGRWVEVQRRGRTLTENELRGLPPEVLAAIFAVDRGWAREAEVDMLVPSPHGARPVTVTHTGRVLIVDDGEPIPAAGPVHPATDAQRRALASRHGVSPPIDGAATWTKAELEVVDATLAALSEAERTAVSGALLRREATSPRAATRELGWFDPSHEPPVIELYDAAFEAGVGAVGPVESMRPAVAMTLAHEIAHAIADAPLRRIFLGADADPGLRLRRGGPVIAAWREVRDGPGPTSYGARDAHESFAEAFALHLLDPAALERVMPRAAAWFRDGGHLRAATLVNRQGGH